MHPSWPKIEDVAEIARLVPPEIRFGTSSWTYPGWTGLIYNREYPATGAVARQLAEYSRWPLFRSVGIDSFFYRPPSPATLKSYSAALPPDFRCVSKVWDRITARAFNSPRDPGRRGELNPDWLNAPLFQAEVLDPILEHFAPNLGPLVFELQALTGPAALAPAAFANQLDKFFAQLPRVAPYGVEIRNPEFLTPEYFAVLREHGVAHVFNSWTRMPSLGEQLLLHDSITADFIVVRALLRPGRTYADAVDTFSPYDHVQEANPELRADLVAIARTAINLRIPAYVIVNNRAEGCSPLTILEVAKLLEETG